MPEQDSNVPAGSSLYTEYGLTFAVIFIASYYQCGKNVENVARFLQAHRSR
jgi:phosphatidate phosphatase APP1